MTCTWECGCECNQRHLHEPSRGCTCRTTHCPCADTPEETLAFDLWLEALRASVKGLAWVDPTSRDATLVRNPE